MGRLQRPVQRGLFSCLLVLGIIRASAGQDVQSVGTPLIDPSAVDRLVIEGPDDSNSFVGPHRTANAAGWSFTRCHALPDESGETFREVMWKSIFEKQNASDWRPLLISTMFSEGWNEVWVPSPNGSGGALRQGWINAASANIQRAEYFSFSQGFNNQPTSNAYELSYLLLTPLSRRLMLVTSIPLVLVNNAPTAFPTINPQVPSTRSDQSQRTFGDVTFTPRVLLHETKDLSVTAEMTVVTPTGSAPLAGNTELVPNLSFWNNIAGGWVVRGGTGITIPMGSGGNTLINQIAIGQTLTPHDVPLVGDFTYYFAAVVNTPLSSQPTSVVLTPGIRTHLGRSWYFTAGLPTPLTNQRVAELGMIFWLMKGW